VFEIVLILKRIAFYLETSIKKVPNFLFLKYVISVTLNA